MLALAPARSVPAGDDAAALAAIRAAGALVERLLGLPAGQVVARPTGRRLVGLDEQVALRVSWPAAAGITAGMALATVNTRGPYLAHLRVDWAKPIPADHIDEEELLAKARRLLALAGVTEPLGLARQPDELTDSATYAWTAMEGDAHAGDDADMAFSVPAGRLLSWRMYRAPGARIEPRISRAEALRLAGAELHRYRSLVIAEDQVQLRLHYSDAPNDGPAWLIGLTPPSGFRQGRIADFIALDAVTGAVLRIEPKSISLPLPVGAEEAGARG